MVTPMFSINFACRKCEGNICEAVEQDEKLCDYVETVREFTYLVDRVSKFEIQDYFLATTYNTKHLLRINISFNMNIVTAMTRINLLGMEEP